MELAFPGGPIQTPVLAQTVLEILGSLAVTSRSVEFTIFGLLADSGWVIRDLPLECVPNATSRIKMVQGYDGTGSR